MTFMPLDYHSLYHFLGPFAIYLLLIRIVSFKIHTLRSYVQWTYPKSARLPCAGIALMFVMVWELVIDQLRILPWVADPRGGDLGDIVLGILGILGGLLLV